MDKHGFYFLCILFALTLTGCSESTEGQAGGPPAPAVSVADVLVRDITRWQEFSGRIAAKEIVQIRPRVGGVIKEVHYREGNMVNEGDLLFTIDPEPYRAELERAQAEFERAKAQATLTRLESRRAKNLLKRKLLSQDEYDQRKAAEDQANANVQAANANHDLAKLNLSYTEVRSPIHGRTGRALKTKGNLVSSDPTPDQLTTVLSLDPVYVEFDSDENTYLQYLASNLSAEDQPLQHKVYIGLGNESGFPREGILGFVDNRFSPDTGSIRMRAVLENKNYLLTPGLFVRVKLLDTTAKQTILISESAILTDQDRKYVYVLGKDNQAIRKDITIGRSYEKFKIVESGLKASDKVIVHGVQKIFFPNMPVNPQTIAMGEPPATPQPAGPNAAH